MINETDTITEKLKFIGFFLGFSVLFFCLGAAGLWAAYFGSVAAILVFTVPIMISNRKNRTGRVQ